MVRKILFVLTSHGELGYSGIRTGVCMDDFALSYRRFSEADFSVVTASPKGGRVPVAADMDGNGSFCSRERQHCRLRALEQTLPLAEVEPLEFDGLFYPGGHGLLWDVVPNCRNIRIVSDFFRRNCPVGAVGHGVAALLNGRCRDGSSVLSGRRIVCRSLGDDRSAGVAETMPFAVESRLCSCGARLEAKGSLGHARVCIDGNLVTARDFRALDALLDAMLEMLKMHCLCRRS